MKLYTSIRCALLGVAAAGTVPSGVAIDSQSLLPVLQNQAVTRTRLYPEESDIAFPTLGGVVLRDDRYKLIRKKTGADEFYDLQPDPYEFTNLLASGVSAMTATRQSYYQRLRFDLGRYSTGTSPVVSSSGLSGSDFSMTVLQTAGATQTLWRCPDLAAGFWSPVSGATSIVSGSDITFTDAAPPATAAYCSVAAETP